MQLARLVRSPPLMEEGRAPIVDSRKIPKEKDVFLSEEEEKGTGRSLWPLYQDPTRRLDHPLTSELT